MRRRAAGVLAVLALAVGPRAAEVDAPGDRLVFAQIRHAGDWDPYPEAWSSAAALLRNATSLDPWPARRVVSLDGDALPESPFLVLAGRGDPGLTDGEVARLREHLRAGGFLWIDNTEGGSSNPFDRAAQALPSRLFPSETWRPVPGDHALFRSFFLLPRAGGRRQTDGRLWGLWAGDRLVAVYDRNDVLGALARDRVGQPLYPCEPGGEGQRREAQKTFTNIVFFALTGTYNTDAVHQPFLERRFRERP